MYHGKKYRSRSIIKIRKDQLALELVRFQLKWLLNIKCIATLRSSLEQF